MGLPIWDNVPSSLSSCIPHLRGRWSPNPDRGGWHRHARAPVRAGQGYCRSPTLLCPLFLPQELVILKYLGLAHQGQYFIQCLDYPCHPLCKKFTCGHSLAAFPSYCSNVTDYQKGLLIMFWKLQIYLLFIYAEIHTCFISY